MTNLVRISVIIVLIVLPFGVYGQKDTDDPVIKIFNKYEEHDGVESVTISPALLGMMRTNDKKTQDLLSKITGLRILTITDGADSKIRANRETLTSELQSVVKKDFVEFMAVKNAGERIELYVRNNPECKDCKSALLFITSTSNSVTVMHLAGTIDKTLIDAVMNGDIGISK